MPTARRTGPSAFPFQLPSRCLHIMAAPASFRLRRDCALGGLFYPRDEGPHEGPHFLILLCSTQSGPCTL